MISSRSARKHDSFARITEIAHEYEENGRHILLTRNPQSPNSAINELMNPRNVVHYSDRQNATT